MNWQELKRSLKKLAYPPQPFHAPFVDSIMSINKRAKRLLLLQKS
jgi:hypothetical protein